MSMNSCSASFFNNSHQKSKKCSANCDNNMGCYFLDFKVDRIGENYSICRFTSVDAEKIFIGSFFVLGFAIPLSAICVMYGCVLRKLLYGFAPGDSQTESSMRSKKRAVKMVMVIFALCWLPIHVSQMAHTFGHVPRSEAITAFHVAAICLAYMNSCMNPILYTFLSEMFRKSFRKMLCRE